MFLCLVSQSVFVVVFCFLSLFIFLGWFCFRILRSERKVSKSSYSHDIENFYFKRDSLMSDCEIRFQVNLACVVDKISNSKYRNELFRNIDFGIFDSSFCPLCLIEINDSSHKQPERHERDLKIKFICEQADLPLLTFWTSYGVNISYIKSKIYAVLGLAEF